MSEVRQRYLLLLILGQVQPLQAAKLNSFLTLGETPYMLTSVHAKAFWRETLRRLVAWKEEKIVGEVK